MDSHRTGESRFPIYDLFSSIQGEATWAGQAMLFLRFSGCPLSCSWCDEPQHKDPQISRQLTAQEILEELRQTGPNLFHILLTGGEPLAVKELAQLVHFLKSQGYWVAMETSGVGGPMPLELDWITLSPKTPLPEALFAMANEIKYVVGASPIAQQAEEIQKRTKVHTNVWVQPQSAGIPKTPKVGQPPPSESSYVWPVPQNHGLASEKSYVQHIQHDHGLALNHDALQQCLKQIKNSGGKIRLSLQTHKLVGLP